ISKWTTGFPTVLLLSSSLLLDQAQCLALRILERCHLSAVRDGPRTAEILCAERLNLAQCRCEIVDRHEEGDVPGPAFGAGADASAQSRVLDQRVVRRAADRIEFPIERLLVELAQARRVLAYDLEVNDLVSHDASPSYFSTIGALYDVYL